MANEYGAVSSGEGDFGGGSDDLSDMLSAADAAADVAETQASNEDLTEADLLRVSSSASEQMAAEQQEETPATEEPAVDEAEAERAEPVAADSHETQEQLSSTEASAPAKRRFPSINDNKDYIARVVKVLDTYRALNDDSKEITSVLLSAESEHELIYAALNADDLLLETLTALSESKTLEPVERAFYLLSLEKKVLTSVGELTMGFVDDDNSLEGLSSLDYAKQLVFAIESLDREVVTCIGDAKAVIAAGKRES